MFQCAKVKGHQCVRLEVIDVKGQGHWSSMEHSKKVHAGGILDKTMDMLGKENKIEYLLFECNILMQEGVSS